jgi:hypothetical protein
VKLHKARSLQKDQFKPEGQGELAGRKTEPWEIIYSKLFADFMAGAHLATAIRNRKLQSSSKCSSYSLFVLGYHRPGNLLFGVT